MPKQVKKGKLIPLEELNKKYEGKFYLVKGNNPNKIDDVDIGPNNKNGLSVNDGEIIQVRGKDIRVFSAEPMFNGMSPASLLYGGANPDEVFAMQEQWKDTNKVRDDGTKYKNGGYKTKLTDDEEKAFRSWYSMMAPISGLSLNPDDKEHYYDYRGYWKNTPKEKLVFRVNDINHLPDTYKTPGHPTFSEESIYASKENPGGRWVGDKFYTREEINDSLVSRIADKYLGDRGEIIGRWEYEKTKRNDSKEDNSPSIKFAGVNTDISKFLDERGVTKSALKSINNYAKHFGINPYSLLSGLILENGSNRGGIVSTESGGFGVNDYADKLIPSELKYKSSSDYMNFADNFIKNIGLEGSGRERDTTYINKVIDRKLRQLQKVADADTISTSIGKYARLVNEVGFEGINPNQKGYTDYNGTVRSSYPEMIDSATESLQKVYPNLFSNNKRFGGTHINNQGNMRTNKRTKTINGTKWNPVTGRFEFEPIEFNYTPIIKKPEAITMPTENPNKFKLNSGDLISAGSSLVSNAATLAANLIENSGRKYVAEETPILQARKMKDRIRIDRYTDAMKEQAARLERGISRGMASSRSRFDTLRDIRQNLSDSLGNAYASKEQQETALINQNIANQQQIYNTNAANIINTANRNRLNKTNLYNQRINDTRDAVVDFTNGMNSIVNGERGILARRDNRRYNIASLAASALANPYGAKAFASNDYKTYINLMRRLIDGNIG